MPWKNQCNPLRSRNMKSFQLAMIFHSLQTIGTQGFHIKPNDMSIKKENFPYDHGIENFSEVERASDGKSL
jgi:hypothetical protein